MNGWTSGRMDGEINRRTEGWSNGWMDKFGYFRISVLNCCFLLRYYSRPVADVSSTQEAKHLNLGSCRHTQTHTSLRSCHMIVTYLIGLFLPSCFTSSRRPDMMVGDAVIKELCGDISHLKPPLRSALLCCCGRPPGRHSACTSPIFSIASSELPTSPHSTSS